MGQLTALAVKNAKPGRHADGQGLYLLVKPTGAKSWLLRVQQEGRRRDIGLGSLAATSLAEAREKAAELRKHAKNGRDPIRERDKDKRAALTFEQAAVEAHKALAAGWAEKTAKGFLSSLKEHAYPALGKRRVDQIEAGDIQAALRPIWTDKPVMAAKVRQRIGIVLNFAHGQGWRSSEAPTKSVRVASADVARDALVQLVGKPIGRSREGHVMVRGAALTCRSYGSAGRGRTDARCRSAQHGDLSCAMIRTRTVVRWERYWRGGGC